MALKLVKADSSYASNTANPAVTGTPCTFAAWVRRSSNSTDQTVVSVGANTNPQEYFQVNTRLFNNRVEYWAKGNGTTMGMQVTADLPATNTWYHVAARSSSATSHKVYWNGTANTATSTTNIGSFSNLANTHVGARWIDAAGRTGYADAYIAEVGIWNVALTDNEINSLSYGVPPIRIRPASLRSYYPLWGPGQFTNRDFGLNKYPLNSSSFQPYAYLHAPVSPYQPPRIAMPFRYRLSPPKVETYVRDETTSSTTSLTLSVPPNTQNGDLLLALITTDGNPTITRPNGWTNPGGGTANGNEVRQEVHTREARDEPANYTWSTNANETICGAILRISNVDFSTGSPLSQDATGTGTTNTVVCPSVTTTEKPTLIVRFASADDNDITIDTGMPSGGLFLRASTTGGPHNSSHGIAAVQKHDTGATGTANFSLTATEEWVGRTVACRLRPDRSAFITLGGVSHAVSAG